MAIITYDYNNLPKPKKEDLERIDAIRDDEIDYSEMPKLTDKDWERAMTYSQFLAHLRAKKNQRKK